MQRNLKKIVYDVLLFGRMYATIGYFNLAI